MIKALEDEKVRKFPVRAETRVAKRYPCVSITPGTNSNYPTCFDYDSIRDADEWQDFLREELVLSRNETPRPISEQAAEQEKLIDDTNQLPKSKENPIVSVQNHAITCQIIRFTSSKATEPNFLFRAHRRSNEKKEIEKAKIDSQAKRSKTKWH